MTFKCYLSVHLNGWCPQWMIVWETTGQEGQDETIYVKPNSNVYIR